jgi:hypothetical protein
VFSTMKRHHHCPRLLFCKHEKAMTSNYTICRCSTMVLQEQNDNDE